MVCECISYNQPQPNQSVTERVLTPPASLNLGRDTVCVDACIVEQVEALWSAGVVTLSTCCGHNDDAKRHVVVAPEHTAIAKQTLERFDRPLTVYCWMLVAA